MEDEDMSQILHLDNMLDQLQIAPDGEDIARGADPGGVHQGVVSEAAPLSDRGHGNLSTKHSQYRNSRRDIQPQPATNRYSNAPARTITNSAVGALSGRASQSSSVGEQFVKFTDVAALFPRREFKDMVVRFLILVLKCHIVAFVSRWVKGY